MPNYSGYQVFKNWDHPVPLERANLFAEFRGELQGLTLKGKRVLEIGFGRGYFLEYARDEGAEVIGTEFIPELVAKNRAAGFNVHIGPLENLPDLTKPEAFDLIVAFDVLEHMDLQALKRNLEMFSIMLVPGGHLLVRFPNGQSPLSAVPQNGDVTHMTVLSVEKIKQLTIMSNLIPVRSGNAFRERNGSLIKKVRKGLAYAARDFIEVVLGYIYFRGRIPLDPVCTVVLKKVSSQFSG